MLKCWWKVYEVASFDVIYCNELLDSWSRPAKSQVYQLGKTVNFQVSAPHLSTGGKLYINTCYATPSSGSEPSLKYTIIDKFGWVMDGKNLLVLPLVLWFAVNWDHSVIMLTSTAACWTARATPGPLSSSLGQTTPWDSPSRLSSSLQTLTQRWVQCIILWIHTVLAAALTLFPFLGQCSLQIICHIWGSGSCTQIMHLQREQVSVDTIN